MDYHDGKPTVLVVEDDASLRRLIVHMLASGGFANLEAGEASDALAKVRERGGELGLAIIDMVMPGVSGLDLAADLGREYPNLKILYISGYVGSLVAEALARRSPERVLMKPFTEEALLARVRDLVGIVPVVTRGSLG
jgi:CheY-like chemotaxis protein